MEQKKIAVFVGSLRKESFNRKMAKALMKVSPDSLNLEIVEIGELPLYNQDLDDNPPAVHTQFRESLKKLVLPALSWIKIQLSAVKQYCNTVVGKSSESTGDRFNLLNLAVYSFRERVRYAVL